MSELLDGDEANFWLGITVPSDGDAFVKASDLKPAFQALIDNDVHLNARTQVYIANRVTKKSTAALQILAAGPTTVTETLFSAGITTAVGDEIEIHFAGIAAVEHSEPPVTGAGSHPLGLRINMQASEDGGTTWTSAGIAILQSSVPGGDASGVDVEANQAIIGLYTIASGSGTLTVRLQLSFEAGTADAGCVCELISYRATLFQIRGA